MPKGANSLFFFSPMRTYGGWTNEKLFESSSHRLQIAQSHPGPLPLQG